MIIFIITIILGITILFLPEIIENIVLNLIEVGISWIGQLALRSEGENFPAISEIGDNNIRHVKDRHGFFKVY